MCADKSLDRSCSPCRRSYTQSVLRTHNHTIGRVMTPEESDTFREFDIQLKELTKLHIEAKDNVKFLSTLERHFKSISTGALHEVADTIPRPGAESSDW